MTKRDIVKKVTVSVVTLLCLTIVLGLILRDNLEDIYLAFSELTVSDILWLFVMGTSYQFLDGLACLILVRSITPTFSYHRALAVIYLGVFGKTSTFGAGTIPLQAYYLHRNGIEIGHGVGIMTFSYVLHKVTILFYASVLLLFEGNWFRSALPELHPYLIAGYLICLAIIGFLLIICTWNRAHHLALYLLRKIPNTGKWPVRKQKIQQQLDYLYLETSSFLKNRKVVLLVALTHTIKLGILCAIPYTCLLLLEESPISLMHGELLTALMLLIVSAIPNVAGIGPTEAVFFLIYNPLLGSALTAASLLLFRISTYYFPFIVSVVTFMIVQIRLLLNTQSGEAENENRSY